MSDVKALVKPELLRWARERAGLSLAGLAERLCAAEDGVAEVEAGLAQVSLEEAGIWANACGVPFGYMFLSEPPDLQPPGPLELPEALESVLDLATDAIAEEEARWGGRDGVIRRHGERGSYEALEMVREHAREMAARKDER